MVTLLHVYSVYNLDGGSVGMLCMILARYIKRGWCICCMHMTLDVGYYIAYVQYMFV